MYSLYFILRTHEIVIPMVTNSQLTLLLVSGRRHPRGPGLVLLRITAWEIVKICR